jgi:hypothetical protein
MMGDGEKNGLMMGRGRGTDRIRNDIVRVKSVSYSLTQHLQNESHLHRQKC